MKTDDEILNDYIRANFLKPDDEIRRGMNGCYDLQMHLYKIRWNELIAALKKEIKPLIEWLDRKLTK